MVETRQYDLADPDVNALNKRQDQTNLLKKADLHIHTNFSDGRATPEEVVNIALAIGLQAIAITDHDVYEASDAAFNYTQQHNFPLEVVRGVELSTSDGHLLVYDIQGVIPVGLSLVESLRHVHRQGGIAVAPHPGLPYISSLTFEKIAEVLSSDDPEVYFDGIEIHNGSGDRLQRFDKSGRLFNNNSQKLSRFITKHSRNLKFGALIGGSDAHTRRVGDVITCYSQASVIDAIKDRDTMVMVSQASFATDLSELIKMAYSIFRSKISP